MDKLDGWLLSRAQENIPLTSRPFKAIAEEAGSSEDEVLKRLTSLKEAKIIRQLSAIFDTQSLGYQSTLVAAKVDPERADEAATVINKHPGVSHNYLRNHQFNLWFTIPLPPDHSMEHSVGNLCERAGVVRWFLLPSLKMYKIKTHFDTTGERGLTEKEHPSSVSSHRKKNNPPLPPLTENEIAVIRVLQKDFPLVSEPYANLARESGLTEDEIINTGRVLQEQGRLRRIAAVLHHRSVGFKANGMVVWKVPEGQEDHIGALFATYRAVSHCYRRPTFHDWPYNIFTMIHGRSPEECESIMQAMSRETGLTDYRPLYSVKEYKKTRVTYFAPELDSLKVG